MVKIRQALLRLGCGVLLALWFIVLFLPCAMIVLAVQQEIQWTYSDIPEDNGRVWMIQEAKARGIGFANTRRVTISDPMDANQTAVCTIRDGGFLMWEGQADPLHFCSCYRQQTNPQTNQQAKQWLSIAEGAEACQLAGEPLRNLPLITPISSR